MSQSVNSTDLESNIVDEEGGGGTSTNLIKSNQNVVDEIPSQDMSVCLESGNLLASSINSPTTTSSAAATANEPQEICNNSTTPTLTTVVNSSNDVNNASVIQSNNNSDKNKQQTPPQTKNITKLIVTTTTNHQQCSTSGQQQQTTTVLQKVVNSPLITVLNPTVPLTVVKTLCVTSSITSAPQFTLVNASGPLSVTNTIGKSPTITLLNAPVTVVKAITQQQQQNIEKNVTDTVSNSVSVNNVVATVTTSAITQQQQTVSVSTVENRGHNVFVKNTTTQCVQNSFDEGATAVQQQQQQHVPEMPQSHKLLTANNFPTTLPKPPSNNGQRSKLKILSNVVMPGTSQQQQNNIILNKTNSNATTITATATQQRYISPRQKVFNAQPTTNITTTTTTKFVTAGNNLIKNVPLKQVQDKSPTRLVYPTHKNQIKTLPPINNYVDKQQHGIKTLSPTAQKNVPPPGGRIQRNTSGLRTIPPQRPQKMPNKPNYIGKHAIQAQKVRQTNRLNKTMKLSHQNQQQTYNNYNANVNLMQEKQLTFNQALTAEIIETLSCNKTNIYGGNTSGGGGKHFEIVPQTRYETVYNYDKQEQHQSVEEKSKSGLDALSLICQAVLLDHNYNATLPPDSPRPTSMNNAQSQINGISSTSSLYSPPGNGVGSVKRRQMPPLNTLSTATNLSNTSSILNQPSSQSILPQCNNAQISQSNIQTYPPIQQQQQQQQQQQDDDAASDISDLSERKHDTEGEETDTAPEAEAVGNNDDMFGDYVTRCICGYLHDDGYMVECDHCKVWQHVQCVVKNKQIPDEYLCEVCDPSKPIDRHKARLVQQQWLRDRQFSDPKLTRKDGKLKDVFPKHNKDNVSDTDSSDNEHAVHNNNVVGKGRGINRRKTESKQRQQQRRDSTKDSTSSSTQQPVQQQQQRRQKRRERKVVKRKSKVQQQKLNNNSDDENNHDLWSSRLPQLHQWIEKYEEAVTNHYSPELRARISSIRVNGAHTDVTIQHNNDSTVNKCRIHTQPLTEIKYLVSTVSLAPNTSVIELRGKYMLSQQHRNNTNGGNCGSGGGSNSNTSTLSTRQNSQRPGPFLFFYRLQKDNTEVCVDTRTYGNSARFIRRSCKPNAELRHCIEKGVLHLYIVTITQVDKNCELTIKHESHDLAAIGTTQIACACGNPDECTVNKTTIKKNGETTEVFRKRRGRRTASVSVSEAHNTSQTCAKIKEEPPQVPIAVTSNVDSLPSPVKQEIKIEPVVEAIKSEIEEKPKVDIKEIDEKIVETKCEKIEEIEEKIKKEEEEKSPISTPIATRRSSQYKSDKEDTTSDCSTNVKEEKTKSAKKMSREERKLEAILRAIEQMEKADQRKQEHQAKQAHRRESEPNPNQKDDDRIEPKLKRRRRKGRARTSSTNASQTSSNRRNRLNSTDSCITSGDEILLSPTTNDSNQSTSRTYSRTEQNDKTAVGLLLALSNGGGEMQKDDNKSPTRDLDSNSNSAQSSPETQLSSACLLVQAAVEPLESGFKFPKTKKGLMNEWLNKGPETNQGNVTTASSISPSSLQPHITNNEYDGNLFSPAKNLAALAQAASFCDAVTGGGGGGGGGNVQPRGNAKKRWLRQAISEDHCDSPSSSRPESPPVSEMVAPPKKRRLPRESLSNEASPPTTPTSSVPPTSLINKQETCDIDSADNESEQSQNIVASTTAVAVGLLTPPLGTPVNQQQSQTTTTPTTAATQQQQQSVCLMDPRLMRDHSFNNCEHLVGTVEKTLSLLGFEERRPETITPTKRKLSITEYRQRKKLNNNDKIEEPEPEPEATSTEENNSSESFKVTARARSGSTSSSTSLSTSDDDDLPMPTLDIAGKAAPAFNSEPTELERQREISSLRLKKAFGLPIDNINKKPSLDVDAILNCELEPKVKPIALPSPTFPIPGSCEVTRDIPSPPLTFKVNSPEPSRLVAVAPQSNSPIIPEQNDESLTMLTLKDECKSNNNEVMVNDESVEQCEDNEEEEEIVMCEKEVIAEEEQEEEMVGVEEQPISPPPIKANNNCSSRSSDSDNENNEEPQQIKPNMFYIPDEEEEEEDENEENIFEETESISYVPPFNNPVYPNSNFTAYTSAIDDDTRYEGRNPSPPPNLDATNYIVDDQET